MADDALSRVRFVDISRPRSDARQGKGKIHKVIPWELVEVVGGQTYLEPIDWVPSNYSSPSEKEVTGYNFVDGGGVFNTFNATGGAAAGPENVG